MQALLMGDPELVPPQTDVLYTGPTEVYGYSYKLSETIDIGVTFDRNGTVNTWEWVPDSSDTGGRVDTYTLWSTDPNDAVGQDFDIRFTDASGDSAMNTPGYGVWHGLEVSRSCNMSMVGFGSFSQTLKIEIKHKDDEIVLQEFYIYFNVQMDNGAT
jgi:hypothetical protein